MKSNTNNLMGTAIMLTVGVILCGSLLVPVIDDATQGEITEYINDTPYSYCNLYEFKESDTDDTVVITVCQSSERSIMINGISHTVSAYQPVVVSDGFKIRYYSDNLDLATENGSYGNIATATITINGGLATFSDVNTNEGITLIIAPVAVSWAFMHDPHGDYSAIITESGADIYVPKGGIYSANWINTTREYFSIKAGSDVVYISKAGDTHTSTINWGGEYLNNGIYKMRLASDSNDFTFTVDNNGSPYTVHPFIVVVPKVVIGMSDEDRPINSLLGVIPTIVILSLFVTAAGTVYVRRQD